MKNPRISEYILDVTEPWVGERLDRFVTAECAELSRTRVKKLVEAGHLSMANGDSWRTLEDVSTKVKPGQRFRLRVPDAELAEPEGEAIPLTVLFEDDHLIVIDKPAGIVVHPAAGNWTGTLVNALIAHCGDSLSGIGGIKRPGIVHRLDKDTSGLMVAAKTDIAHTSLTERFAAREIERAYLALCWQAPRPRSGLVEGNIGRSRSNRKKMAVLDRGGKAARTDYRTIQTFGPLAEPLASMIECRLQTGRTHQIRVHMTHIGHPVIGDPLYGRGRRKSTLPEVATASIEALGRQALHAKTLGFEHPATGKNLTFDSKLPSDMVSLLDQLALL